MNILHICNILQKIVLYTNDKIFQFPVWNINQHTTVYRQYIAKVLGTWNEKGILESEHVF